MSCPPLRGSAPDGALGEVRVAAIAAAKGDEHMPEVIASATRAPRMPRHGVNRPALPATINAVKETPALAKFQCRAAADG